MVKLAKKYGIGINFQVAYNYSTAEMMSPGKKDLYSVIIQLLNLKKKYILL
jgi:hypothetical protein